MTEVQHLGPAGLRLMKNIKRIREGRGMSTTRLAAALEQLGQPIPATGITRIEKGQRRVDVDELIALAEVLDVDPIRLLRESLAVTVTIGPCRLVDELAVLKPPTDGLTEDFLSRLAAAYRELVLAKRAPAPAIAEQTGAPVGTVHRWIAESRKRGHLPPAVRGRAG